MRIEDHNPIQRHRRVGRKNAREQSSLEPATDDDPFQHRLRYLHQATPLHDSSLAAEPEFNRCAPRRAPAGTSLLSLPGALGW